MAGHSTPAASVRHRWRRFTRRVPEPAHRRSDGALRSWGGSRPPTQIGRSGAGVTHDGWIHAVLRSLDSPALDTDTLDSYVPPIADDFGVLVSALSDPMTGRA